MLRSYSMRRVLNRERPGGIAVKSPLSSDRLTSFSGSMSLRLLDIGAKLRLLSQTLSTWSWLLSKSRASFTFATRPLSTIACAPNALPP